MYLAGWLVQRREAGRYRYNHVRTFIFLFPRSISDFQSDVGVNRRAWFDSLGLLRDGLQATRYLPHRVSLVLCITQCSVPCHSREECSMMSSTTFLGRWVSEVVWGNPGYLTRLTDGPTGRCTRGSAPVTNLGNYLGIPRYLWSVEWNWCIDECLETGLCS